MLRNIKTSSGLLIIILILGVLLGVLYSQEDFPEINISSLAGLNNHVPQKLFNIHLSSEILKQSDVLLIRIDNLKEPKANLGSKQIGFVKIKDNWFGFLGISVNMEPGDYDLNIGDETRQIKVVKKDFPITELIITDELEQEGYTPSSISDNIIKENAMIKNILDIYNDTAYFDNPFDYPLDKIDVVGMYGAIRKSGDYSAQHLGVDLDADMNTVVYTVNDGIVVFAKELTNYGKTVIIDHGLGIYSLYLHLEAFKVLEKDKVSKGDIIGLSGNTGYSIAPHLHFSIKVNGSSVDPLNFIETINKEMVWK